MAYGLDLRLFVETGPVQQSAVHAAIVRGASSRRVALGARRSVPAPANDAAPDFGDGYPVAL
jgi:hypothetical protein